MQGWGCVQKDTEKEYVNLPKLDITEWLSYYPSFRILPTSPPPYPPHEYGHSTWAQLKNHQA